MSEKTEDIAELARTGRLPEDPAKHAAPVTKKAERIAEDEGRVYTSKALLKDAYERTRTPVQMQDRCTTGHWRMDRDTGGLRKAFVWIFGAETNWGKTSWLVQVADENLRKGKRVLIVTVEDPPELFGSRLLTRRAEVSARRVEQGNLDQEEIQKAINAASTGIDEPCLLDARERSVEWAAKHARRLILEHQIDLVLFDYLHAFDSEKPNRNSDNRRLQVNYIGRTLTNVIKGSGCAGVIFAQITCEEGKRPTKYSIRDSKDVTNAAEVVALGWTPDKEQRSAQGECLARAGERCIIVDKNKSGPSKRLYQAEWNNEGAYFETVKAPDQWRYDFVDDIAAPMTLPPL